MRVDMNFEDKEGTKEEMSDTTEDQIEGIILMIYRQSMKGIM